MEEKKDILDSEKAQNEKSTNWKAWYWGLTIFLALQIVLFIVISNWYGE
ncbi:MAG: hypothetical protein P8I55_15840 [Crocinitomix sp.]|nr:hypothetical protein [Crocinitomix sp.]|tara:strand:- start:976 stop:1122 length:147 start_codon:yes stop_codon:yes gene_type:complete